VDSKSFFQNCPGTIIALAGFHQRTAAAMLEQIFNTYFATTDLADKVVTVAEVADPAHRILRDVDTLSDISNIDIVLYLLSRSQLADLAVNLPFFVIDQTTDSTTGVPVVRNTHLNSQKTFYLGRDLNSYALANQTMASSKRAFPEDLQFSLPDLQVVGDWQRECAAAAAITALEFGFKPDLIQQALAAFAELPHHLDFIREVSGVKYYDDGVSVTPELATISIRTFNQPIVISAHKFPKELVKRQIIIPAPTTPESVKTTNDTTANASTLGISEPLVDYADTLADAAGLASIFALEGDTVLFAPAVPGINPEQFVMEVNKL